MNFPLPLVKIIHAYIADPLQVLRQELHHRVEIGNSFARICYPEREFRTIFLKKRGSQSIRDFLWKI